MPGELDMYKNSTQSPVYEKGYPSYDAVNRKNESIVVDTEKKNEKAPIDQDKIRKAGW
jgi:hypothetical protein